MCRICCSTWKLCRNLAQNDLLVELKSLFHSLPLHVSLYAFSVYVWLSLVMRFAFMNDQCCNPIFSNVA